MRARPAIAIWALLASAAIARAEPTVSIHAQACPSASAIERALPDRVRVTDRAPVELVVEDVDGGALVRIAGSSEVRLAGSDCAVLASAAAALADAWLVELPAPLVETAPPVAPEPLEPARLATRVEPVATAPARWTLSAGVGLVVDDSGTATATGATLAWWRWRALGVQLRVMRTSAERLGMTADVTRQTWSGALLVAGRVGAGRLWLEGGAGAAAVVSQIDAVTESGLMRAEAAVAATASGGLELWHGAAFRLDVGALAYPVRERYTLQAMTVARSPWAELTLGGGLEIAFGGRSR